MEVRVRGAGPDDLEAVAALERACLGEDAWSEGLVREGIDGALPTVTYLVAEADGEVVGHAVASAAGDVLELQRIAVRGDLRRAGVGRRLLAAVAATVGSDERVLLEVREDNAGALAFYAHAGFTEVARRPRYYAGGAAALVLEARASSLRTASDA